MGCPAFIDDQTLHHAYVHSRGQNGAIDTVAGQLAETYGLHRQRHLTMGAGGYQADVDYTKISALLNIPCIHFVAERHALSDLNDNDPNFHFQMDMIVAAGAFVAELKDVIAEIGAMAETLSPEQKAKFVEAIFNTYQLQQAREGRIELTVAQIETLSLETIEILDDLAKDMVLPQGLKQISINIIRDHATTHGLDSVHGRLDRFEKETTPKALLEQSVEGLITTLQAMLDTNDLDDKTRERIETILEQIDQLEEGEPLTRDLMKELKGLSDYFETQVELGGISPELMKLSSDLKQDIFKVSEANTLVKADKYNLTVAQVRAIETMMDRLDEIAENLPDTERDLKQEIAEAVRLLDQEPTSLKAVAALDTLVDKIMSSKIQNIGVAMPVLSAAIASFSSERKFIQKIQIDNFARDQKIPRESAQDFVATYKTLQSLGSEKSGLAPPVRTQIKEALQAMSVAPISIAATAKLQSIIPVILPKIHTSVSAPLKQVTQQVIATQMKVAETVYAVPKKMVEQSVKMFQSLDHLKQSVMTATKPLFTKIGGNNDVPATPNPIITTIEQAMESINRAPDKIDAVVATVTATVANGVENLATKVTSVSDVLQETKGRVEEFTKQAVETIAEKTGKPIIIVKNMVSSMIEQVKSSLSTTPATPKPTEGYVAPKVTEAQKSQADALFGTAQAEQKKGFFSSVKSKCESCSAAFCDACTGAAMKALSKFTIKPLTSIFDGVAKSTGMKKTRSLGAAPAPK
jgi:hypothetical protein